MSDLHLRLELLAVEAWALAEASSLRQLGRDRARAIRAATPAHRAELSAAAHAALALRAAELRARLSAWLAEIAARHPPQDAA